MRPRRRYSKESRGEAWAWPLWIVQLVLEQLVNGVPPASIPAVIRSHAEAVAEPGESVDVPSVNFCRSMRAVLRVLVETLAAYRLAKEGRWKQLFTDGTSRRQIAMQNLLIAITDENDELVPLLLSAAHAVEGESSEDQCTAVLEMIERAGARLTRWEEVISEKFPEYDHDISEASEMNIGKLGFGGAVATDNCNPALKLKRLLVERIKEAAEEIDEDEDVLVLEVDCWHHLRNVWLGGMTKHLTSHLRAALHDELEAIDSRLALGRGRPSDAVRLIWCSSR